MYFKSSLKVQYNVLLKHVFIGYIEVVTCLFQEFYLLHHRLSYPILNSLTMSVMVTPNDKLLDQCRWFQSRENCSASDYVKMNGLLKNLPRQ